MKWRTESRAVSQVFPSTPLSWMALSTSSAMKGKHSRKGKHPAMHSRVFLERHFLITSLFSKDILTSLARVGVDIYKNVGIQSASYRFFCMKA